MSYQYVKNSDLIYRLKDGAYIPPDLKNMDYLEYLEWVKGGGVTASASIVQPSPEELENAVVRDYPKLKALRNMAPAQIQTWVDNNVNTLADAKDLLKTLAIAVAILARRI